MPKVALALSIVALAAAGAAFLRPSGGSGESGGASREQLDALRRDARTLARDETRQAAQDLLRELDARVARIDGLRKDLERGIVEVQRAAKAAAESGSGGLDEAQETWRSMGEELRAKLLAQEKEIEGLRASLLEVSELASAPRPPTGPEAPPGGPGGEPSPPPAGPTGPPLPAAPVRDPEEVRREIEKALADLASEDLPTLFAAIEALRKDRALAGVEPLSRILAEHKDPFARMGAATALGDIPSADGVASLVEALVDKDPMVAQQAGKSIRLLTGHDLQISARAGIRERRQARTDFKEWWKDNEASVRARLSEAPP